MARDGSGNYSLPVNSWNPAVNGVSATPPDWQALINDVASALTQSLSRDGQTPMSGNLVMAGNKVTGLGNANANGQAIIYGQTNAALAGLTLTATLTMTAAAANYAAEVDIVSAATVDLGGAAANQIRITGATGPITSFGTTYTGPRFVRLASTPTFTNSATLVLPGGADIVGAAGDTFIALPLPAAAGWYVSNYVRASGLPIVSAAATIQRGYIDGLTLSTAGASTTMSIAAGQATDSTNAVLMTLSAIAKTTAAWAVGTAAGGKAETGATANNTTYHWYEIRRPDTGVVDVCFSTSATGLVAGSYVSGGGNVANAYTQFRRIASTRTNGSAQWVKFFQRGDLFTLDVQANDYNSANNPGTAAILIPLTSIPTGILVQALFVEQCIYNNSFYFTLFTDPAQTDTTPSITAFTFYHFFSSGGMKFGRTAQIGTDTSAQVRRRQDASGALDSFNINTVGWIDQRNKNA